MVEESARVLKVDGDVVWVQAIAKSACGSCQAQKGCGHSLLAKTGQKQIDLPVARNGVDVHENDEVIIGVPEQAILRSSLLMYGVPLMTMMAVAMTASLFGVEEKLGVLFAFIALVTGFVWVSRRAKSANYAHWHPRLMRKAQAVESHIPMCEVH
jgi:sigma-E factor negative regulatory protein RseC